MNKKNILLLVLATGVILTGCKPNNSSSSNPTQSEASNSQLVTSSESSTASSLTTGTTSSSASSTTSSSASSTTSSSASSTTSSIISSSSSSSSSIVENNWNSALLTLIKEVVSTNITSLPYLTNSSYTYDEETEDEATVSMIISTTKNNYDSYLDTLRSTYTSLDSFEDEYGEMCYNFLISNNEHTYIQISGEEDKDGFIVYIFIFRETLSSQTSFTNSDLENIKAYVSSSITSIPFLKNYIYQIVEDDENENSVYVDFLTDEDLYNAYIETLKSTYGTPITDTENGITFYTFTVSEENGIYLDVCSFEDQLFYATVNIYMEKNTGGDDVNEPVEENYIVLDTTSLGFTGLSEYPKKTTTKTINDVTFSSTGNVGNVMTDNYKQFNCIQVKKFDKNVIQSIRNTTMMTATNKVVIEVYSSSSASSVKCFTIYASNSVIGQDEKTSVFSNGQIIKSEVASGSIVKYTFEYTFDEKYTYFRVANESTSAIYAKCISFFQSVLPGGDNEEDDPSENIPLKDVNFTTQSIKNVTDLADYLDGMPTTGKRKVLVLPIDFTEYKASDLGYTIDNLDKAFNGDSNDLLYYSLHDYFYTSSYGKLDLTFDIMPSWIRAEKSLSYYKGLTPTDIYGKTGDDSLCSGEQVLLNEILKKLSTDSSINLSDYDTDGNGTIDSIVMISSNPIEEDDDDSMLGWAFRYWNLLSDPATGDDYDYYTYTDKEVYANDYLWAPYSFLYENVNFSGGSNTDNLNTYTFIHEFSHVLGAEDYYDTSYHSKTSHPFDGKDIMDQAIADHNPFTKIEYGWIENSKLITTKEEITLTLKKFSTTGETYIISNNYDEKKGVFQEYWLMSYYTNDGLNEGNNFGLFDQDGLVIYHVDAKTKADSQNPEYIHLVNNNTYYTGENGTGTKDNLIEFLDKENPIYTKNESTMSILDNNGKKIPYIITVLDITDEEITIKITPNK